jgi:MoaA/NifB/PqqE/SkfB family radical SAM enzyme
VSLGVRLRRDQREIPWMRAARRIFDRRPMHCGIYVTDRCNLACSYCAEFDNTRPHPSLRELETRIDLVVRLGVIKVALAGGEPLLHPEVDSVIAHAKGRGLRVSLTTNALLLDAAMLRRLESAGLDSLQVSVDRISPSRVTRKALERARPALELLRTSGIKSHISGVICADTLDEAGEVLRRGLALDIPTELRLVHGDSAGTPRVPAGEAHRSRALIDLQLSLKRRGLPVHGTTAGLMHERARLSGRQPPWRCVAGYKVFFVSAAGHFWPCSVVRTTRPLEEITLDELRTWNRPKECQDACGIACVIQHSLLMGDPLGFVAGEIAPRLRRYVRRAGRDDELGETRLGRG